MEALRPERNDWRFSHAGKPLGIASLAFLRSSLMKAGLPQKTL